MFGGIGGALKDIGGKAGELLEKGKKDIEDLAAEKKAAAASLIESQVNKTKESFSSALGNAEAQATTAADEAKKAAIDSFDEELKKAEGAVDQTVQQNIESQIEVDLKSATESTPAPPSTPAPAAPESGSPIDAGVKEVEKVLSDGIKQLGVTVDEKIKEVDHLVDEKRGEVTKQVTEAAQGTLNNLGNSEAGSGAMGVLGKAKGLLNF
ncbi:hypothetical protein M8J76_010897 [Diaphorina citri]|nr:hypothetical protein M8J75_010281 [Diaphorina citri]KAI5719484.1 hypothetical protein M8J76_010897 [Diaphorina citri]KAI5720169.1 hypothetical protein M8J77_002904 [Diaphorina citri]